MPDFFHVARFNIVSSAYFSSFSLWNLRVSFFFQWCCSIKILFFIFIVYRSKIAFNFSSSRFNFSFNVVCYHRWWRIFFCSKLFTNVGWFVVLICSLLRCDPVNSRVTARVSLDFFNFTNSLALMLRKNDFCRCMFACNCMIASWFDLLHSTVWRKFVLELQQGCCCLFQPSKTTSTIL